MPRGKSILCTLTMFLSTGSPAAARGADPWRETIELQQTAAAAQQRGDWASAARQLDDAYLAAPEPCSAPGLVLLIQTVEAHRRVDDATGRATCRARTLLEDAIADAACAASRGDLAAELRSLRLARRGAVECVAPSPLTRPVESDVPLAIESAEPAAAGARGNSAPLPISIETHPMIRHRRLQVAGAILVGHGAGLAATFLVGLVRGLRLRSQAGALVSAGVAGCDLSAGLSGVCAEIERDGTRMNDLAIGAGITATASLVAGVALLVLAARRPPAARRIAVRGPVFTLRF